ncbi:choice-of-anchor J domain-containing protein [Streptomyces kaempferi]
MSPSAPTTYATTWRCPWTRAPAPRSATATDTRGPQPTSRAGRATPKDGWTATDDSGSGVTWRFDDPSGSGNDTGGTGQFAEVDSFDGGIDTEETTSLVSPVLDLSGDATPIVSFDNSFTSPRYNSNASVEVSVDGGQTWTSVWHMARTISYGPEAVAIPQAAGKSNVRVRFRYDALHSWYWKVDNVFIGNRSCDSAAAGSWSAPSTTPTPARHSPARPSA